MSKEVSIPISGCFSSKAFVPLGPEGRQIVPPPVEDPPWREAPSRVLCGAERGWGNGLPNDIRGPLAGRKNLPNGSSDIPTIIPWHVPLRNALSPSPVTLLVSRIRRAQPHRLNSRSHTRTLEVFLAAGAPSEDLFYARGGELFPSAWHRRGCSAYLDLAPRFAPPAGLSHPLPLLPRPRPAKRKSAGLRRGYNLSALRA